MKEILSKQEAVEQYGTEKQKEHFAKYKKFTNNNLEQALIKTLEQHYEKVEIVKNPHGRGKVYQCEGKKEEISVREDKRENNGAGQIPYELELHNLVIDYLLKRDKDDSKSMSLTEWAVRMQLVDKKLSSSYYNDLPKVNMMNRLKEKSDIVTDDDIEMLEHAIYTELSTIKNNIRSCFTKLVKARIIMYKVSWYGKIYGTDNAVREVTDEEFKRIGELKKEIAEKHNISIKAIFNRNLPQVQNYWKEYSKRLVEEFNLTYVYEGHNAVVCAPSKDIQNHFKKLAKKNEQMFVSRFDEIGLLNILCNYYKKHGEHAVNRAEKREQNHNKTDGEHILGRKKEEKYVLVYKLILEELKILANEE
ncbi:hypothetical protein LKL95_27550 [Bacillus cereus]|uniref:hypothetical protein n=1 Tax=Bacillus cereus TaxID=1396 RepID=UPI001E557697|nr:hypothetical protein [Bacillus cereus]MCC2397534.1 hypothetical protein [Bacillus cereus]